MLTAWRELDAEIRARSSLALLATAQDVRAQAARLVHDGFVSETGADRLPHLARYLRAARHRLVKAADNPQRDADLAWQVQDVEALYDEAVAKRPADPEVDGGPLDARGAARQPVRPAAGHAGPGVDHPHQEGSDLTRSSLAQRRARYVTVDRTTADGARRRRRVDRGQGMRERLAALVKQVWSRATVATVSTPTSGPVSTTSWRSSATSTPSRAPRTTTR